MRAAELGSLGSGSRQRCSIVGGAIVLAWLWPTLVTACSSFALPPLAVPRNTIAFSGRVTGYPKANGKVLDSENVVGLSVAVLESPLSARPGSSVDVYLFGSAPDCSPLPRSERDLREQYPLGSAVTVIVNSPEGPESQKVSAPLTTSADGWGHVSHLVDPQARTPDGLLDFKAFRGTYEKQSESAFSFEIAWRNAHRGWFEDFEYLRALLELKSATQSTEKVAILENVAFYGRLADELFRQLVQNSHLPATLAASVIRSAAKDHDQR